MNELPRSSCAAETAAPKRVSTFRRVTAFERPLGMRLLRATAALVACLQLGGCAYLAAPSCEAPAQPYIVDTLYFGTAKPSGTVSAEEWRDFLALNVTPRFPQGLSVWPASGQWRGASGEIVREGAQVLRLVHTGDKTAERAISDIMSDYKRRFEQEAVMRVRSAACVSF